MPRKSSVYDALNRYQDPFTAAQVLQALANDIDKAASRCGSTELTAQECLKPLGLSSVAEFRTLKAKGLMIYRRGAAWCLDSRMFRRWVNDQIAQLKARHTKPTPQIFGQPQLF